MNEQSTAASDGDDNPTRRRQFPRWQFHAVDVPLAQQSRGLSARVYKPGLLFDRAIGHVVVKDISLGGAGLLVPSQFPLPKKLLLGIGTSKPLACMVMHRYRVTAKLDFVGVSWHRVRSEQILQTVGIAVKNFKPDDRVVTADQPA